MANYQFVNSLVFSVPVDHKVKIKESKKIDKYLDLSRELKKDVEMKGTMVLIVVDAVLGGLKKRLGEL